MEPATVGAAAAATSAILKLIQHAFAYTEVPDDVRAFQSSIESFTATLKTTRRLRRVKSHLLDSREKLEIDDNIRRGDEILDTISSTIEACRKDLSSKGTVGVRNRLVWLVRNQHSFMSRTHTLRMCHSNLNGDINCMRLLGGGMVGMGKQSPSHDLSEADFEYGIEGTLRPPSSRRRVQSLSRPDSAGSWDGIGHEAKERSEESVSNLGGSIWEPSKEPVWETSSELLRKTSWDLPTIRPTESAWKPLYEESPRNPSRYWTRSRESLTAKFFSKAEEAAQGNKQNERYECYADTYELEDTSSSWGGSTIMSPSLPSMRSFGTLSPPLPLPALDVEPNLDTYFRPAVGDYAVDPDELEDVEQHQVRPPTTARRKVRKSFMIT